MDNNESAIQGLLKGITYLIDVAIQKAPFDKVVNGVVINKSGHTVDLIINGVTYTNVATLIETSRIAVNTTVKVMIPQNKTNKMFVLGIIQ